MSKSQFSRSIALTLGMAIVSTGLLVSISGNAQNSTPGTTTTPTTPATGPTVPVTKPSSGTTTPGGSTTPNGGMTTPGSTTTPGGSMTKPSTTAPAGKTIVDIAGKSKYLTTLVSALKAADLVETLAGEGPYTVFAPTNAAFAKLPKGTLKNLLKPENKEQLKQILTYHVVSGAQTSKLLKSGKIDTVEGSKITLKIRGKQVSVNNAKVIMPDVKASNGVVHVIDTVIMPPTK
jgi:uncharacterized surface protein with fasciclin (FAS1) repeats